MTLLLRATEIIGLPVVALEQGEAVAEVRDVAYGTADACLLGFTLNRRGFLAGPMKRTLPWRYVHGLGRHAVTIVSAAALAEPDDDLRRQVARSRRRVVVGADVLTDAGERLGEVSDVVVLVGRTAEIVGYEVGGGDVLEARGGRHVFIPLPHTLAVSGEALIVPAAVREFVSHDLAGFGAAVERFRGHGAGG